MVVTYHINMQDIQLRILKRIMAENKEASAIR